TASETGSVTGTRTTTPGNPQPVGATDPSPVHSFGQVSPPYAATTQQAGHGGQTPAWGDGDDTRMCTGRRIGMAALAVGGLAVAAYLMRRRMRPKTPYERFMDLASDYLDIASEFTGQAADFASDLARQRHPAWWAALAAAALPLAYYAWPSSEPTYREQ